MAEVGGMLAAAVLKVAAGKVAAAAGDRVMLQWSFGEDLGNMRDTLESIEAVLEDAERRSIEEASVQLWLSRLTRASYEISDMFDEFEVNTTRKSALRKFKVLNPCLLLASEVRMAGKMKNVREKLENIAKQRHDFSFTAGNTSYSQKTIDERETYPEVIEADILGRNQEKHKVITLITEASTSCDFIIFPIYGIGGIGKTTLAQLLFNDPHFKDYDKAWVYVSQTFELKKICDSIRAQLQREQSQLTFTLEPDADPPARKKILIVLDDLWESNDFKVDDLKHSLKKFCSNGHKVHVIVTTRDAGIAQKIQTTEAYAIEPLSSDTCWTIIKQIVGFEDRADKQRLEDTGKEIAMKCKGVALAARALGYILRFKNFDGWVSVKDNDIWKISTTGHTPSPYDDVLASLKLSYISMLPYLRLCFAYCAIFPKGHKIAKDDLIYQWAALGFIKSPNENSTWLQHGESIIRQLLEMSFLQHSKSLSDGQHDKDASLFTMHDMVHDLARSIVGNEVLDASSKSKGNTAGTNCRFLSLADCSMPLNSFVTYPDKIRALRFLGNGNIGRDAPRFSSAKYLQVLDLGECSIQKVPSSFGQLKLLRYLNAPGINDQMIPSCITKLSKLIYLNLRGSSSLLALPESIGEMENLMYLDLSGCSEIRELPESFGKLKNLVHMDFSKCSHVSGVSKSLETLTQLQYLNLSYCKNIGEVPVALSRLTRLQYLNLSCSSYFVGMSNGGVTLTNGELLGTLSNLKYLNLSSAEGLFIKRLPEGLGSFTELEYLNLSGCEHLEELPMSLGNLRNLVHLDLSHCSRVKGIPKALCSLTKLRYLNLSRIPRSLMYLGQLVGPVHLLAELLEAIQKLTELRYLNLSACMSSPYKFYEAGKMSCHYLDIISTLSNLEHLVLSHNGLLTIPDSVCGLRKLHTLDLTGCSIIRELPESIGNMESLKFLIVKDCRLPDKWIMHINKSSVTLPKFVVRVPDGEQRSNLVLLKDVTPSELEISSLENVKSVEEAQIIQLREKHSIVKLKLEWTRGANNEGSVEDMELLRELVPPSSLEKFDLRHYRSASFPPWLMDNATHLQNLVSLKLTGLPQCTSLPPLGQLPKLHSLELEAMPKITKIGREFCGSVKAFTRLEELNVHDMESLEEWTTAYSCGKGVADEFMFPNLKSLSIHGCHKLRVIPCPPRVKYNWSIKESDGLLLQWGESAPHTGSSPSSASVAHLMVYSCMAPMHQWKLLHHLRGLEKLTIDKCDDLSSSSSEIVGVLCSLRELNLNFCDSLIALPQWLGDLTSLQTLSVWESPKLNNLPESMRRLSFLQSLSLHHCSGIQALPEWLGDLVFLKNLTIHDVDIMSLPESIGQLTNLERLKILSCHKLNNFPESMRQLSCLQSLCLEGCRGIQEVPEWFGDLVSLKELDMNDCVNVVSLPESIQQLTNLEVLRIWGCSALQHWCQLEENKMKFGHINQVIPGWHRS